MLEGMFLNIESYSSFWNSFIQRWIKLLQLILQSHELNWSLIAVCKFSRQAREQRLRSWVKMLHRMPCTGRTLYINCIYLVLEELEIKLYFLSKYTYRLKRKILLADSGWRTVVSVKVIPHHLCICVRVNRRTPKSGRRLECDKEYSETHYGVHHWSLPPRSLGACYQETKG